jgi:hypothetical protein
LPLLESLLKEDQFKSAVAYQVDFDGGREFKGAHRIRSQTTLIVFKGGEERGRSIADLDIDSIRKLLSKGL